METVIGGMQRRQGRRAAVRLDTRSGVHGGSRGCTTSRRILFSQVSYLHSPRLPCCCTSSISIGISCEQICLICGRAQDAVTDIEGFSFPAKTYLSNHIPRRVWDVIIHLRRWFFGRTLTITFHDPLLPG